MFSKKEWKYMGLAVVAFIAIFLLSIPLTSWLDGRYTERSQQLIREFTSSPITEHSLQSLSDIGRFAVGRTDCAGGSFQEGDTVVLHGFSFTLDTPSGHNACTYEGEAVTAWKVAKEVPLGKMYPWSIFCEEKELILKPLHAPGCRNSLVLMSANYAAFRNTQFYEHLLELKRKKEEDPERMRREKLIREAVREVARAGQETK